MWRYIIHSCDPAPELDGDRWPLVLCPNDSNSEVVDKGRRRIRVGSSHVTFAVAVCPDCDFDGPAFEVTAGDDLPKPVATRLFEGVWDRLSRAVTRQVAGRFTICSAHGRLVEWPAGAYPPAESELTGVKKGAGVNGTSF